MLGFLGLDEKADFVESGLEMAIINKLQKVWLERGTGYLFESGQKRLRYRAGNSYVDLIYGFGALPKGEPRMVFRPKTDCKGQPDSLSGIG